MFMVCAINFDYKWVFRSCSSSCTILGVSFQSNNMRFSTSIVDWPLIHSKIFIFSLFLNLFHLQFFLVNFYQFCWTNFNVQLMLRLLISKTACIHVILLYTLFGLSHKQFFGLKIIIFNYFVSQKKRDQNQETTTIKIPIFSLSSLTIV